MSIDRLSNMLSSIKNASLSKKESIETVYTKQCEEVAKVLKQEGFLKDVKTFKFKDRSYKGLKIVLEQDDWHRISNIIRISKPGRRLYVSSGDLRKYILKFGVSVVSTSRGIMAAKDARKKKLGGEIICKVI